MKKVTFLKELRKKLDVLEDSEIDDIIKEYENHIDEELKQGKREEDIIREFGSIDELVRETLKAYKISDRYYQTKTEQKEGEKEETFEKTMGKIGHSIVSFFQNLGNVVFQEDGNIALTMIIKLLCIVLMICTLRLPFYFLEYIGIDFWLFDFCYLVIAFIVGYYLLRIWILDTKERHGNEAGKAIQKKGKNTIHATEKETDEAFLKTESISERQETKSKISHVVSVIVRIFLFFFALPFLLITIGCYIFLGVLIALWCQGIYLVGLLLIALGCCLSSTAFTTWCYHIIVKGGK